MGWEGKKKLSEGDGTCTHLVLRMFLKHLLDPSILIPFTLLYRDQEYPDYLTQTA